MVVVKDADVQVAMPVSLTAVVNALATTAVIKAKAQASHVTHLVSQKTVSAASLIKASAVALIAAMARVPRVVIAQQPDVVAQAVAKAVQPIAQAVMVVQVVIAATVVATRNKPSFGLLS
jgi:hypothetical protein